MAIYLSTYQNWITFLFSQDVCNAAKDVAGNSTNPSASDSGDILDVVEVLWGLPSIYWPIIISGAAIVFSAWAYIPLAFMTHSGSLEMPIHESQDQNKSKDSSQSDLETITNFYPLIIFVFLFYCISCGIERIFQSTVFTYGLCGPLALSPQSAAISDSSYNGGFLAGRVIGTLIAGFVKPRNMLLVSLTFCLLASIVLVTSAFKSATGLYVGSGLVGFGVSWQYGSAFSWTAQKVDVTGILASLFASACGVGGMASVPVIGFLTSEADPRSMIWAVLVLSILHWGIFGPMWFTAKRLRTNFESYDVKAEQELGSSNVTEKAGEANDGYLAEDVQL